ncbi:hypothetical protein D3C73_1216260 [compost metagenome]
MSIPMIQIRQTPAQLGIDADLGTQDIRQPRATFEMTQEAAKLDMEQPRGDLEIDQRKAWDALGVGPYLEAAQRIYAQSKNAAMQGIARIVENGNMIGDLRNRSNPIADIAQQLTFDRSEFDYYGDASYDNVDITYTANKPVINVSRGQINLNARLNPAEIEYNRGKLDIYMMQYPKIEFIPPEIDLKW